ncbi:MULTISPECIES: RNB domain-containing ribonuclease [unclassified Campylobacter]|uniref:RNB domain-containing ribonuclease n=1 Tax=unclassified Campylobacter TaxID=2593542 RepID=UPI001237F643|nr:MULTISPECIES: ribonuclease R family protein [unclassified Campylobacter]KAA6225347.1 VacB/RNase II family 3'-5' exoribonuclease [Campylobacter sp. LR185c]KAA6227043.1 VacB/RNase II family 3'-5' exoribonuclease [Campylobacter sp. LR196d]KAA6227614.1 VacB/RNase II family 3'-5' exoribonuclease [Campylobacter sp. LR286c]KAA6230724.1 VacB/RNase II family 3'-5' exoribonuclease [Campylobacter sp. LR291e]KAA8604961.1 ribonuclease R [Campylobacter sp. LR185c]
MKEFLKSLNFGLYANKINNEFKQILRELLANDIIKEYKNKYYLNNGYVFGELDITSKGTGFLKCFDESFTKDLLIENKYLKGADYKDIVVCKLLPLRKKRPSAKVILVLKKANESSIVITKQYANVILGMNIKTGLSVALKASQKSLKALPLGTILKIENVNNNITQVLGHIDDESVDEKISLNLYNKNSEFNQTCINEALANGDSVDASFYPRRKDLRHLAFCTIDPFHAKDFDDAIFYSKQENALYVAIADVSEYVHAYSAIDKEARNRGFSIYFPHVAIPMLPHLLSENICSLKPNLDRLAFCFKLSFDDNYKVVKEELFEAIINSKARFNYDEVDIFLEKKPDLKEISWLYELFKITQILRKERLKNAFEFRTKELRMMLDENLALKNTIYEEDTFSHNLIEDCMLLANKAAAKMIDIGIFRNHLSADSKKIDKLINELASLGIDVKLKPNLPELIRDIQTLADELNLRGEVDKLIIKAQKKAEYASINAGHFGLGFDKYTHFTSPIRRYSDLILHRLLKAKLKNDERLFNYLLLNIDSTCENLSVLEREADKVAFDFMDRKFARWAKKNIGKKFKALIIENTSVNIARLDDDIRGADIILSDINVNLLQKVEVEITQSDIVMAKIFGKITRNLTSED